MQRGLQNSHRENIVDIISGAVKLDSIYVSVSCPSCDHSLTIPTVLAQSKSKQPAPAAERSKIMLPAFWWSAGIATLWGWITCSQDAWRLTMMFGKDHTLLFFFLAHAGIFAVTWCAACALAHFATHSRIRATLSVSLQVGAFVLLAALTGSRFSHGEFYGISFSKFEMVTTWMSMYVTALVAVLAVSGVLLLIEPMLKAPKGWLRLSLATAVLLTFGQLIWTFTTSSTFLVASREFKDVGGLIDHEYFLYGVRSLVAILAEILLQTCIAFAVSFGIGDAVIWIRRGFRSEVRKEKNRRPEER